MFRQFQRIIKDHSSLNKENNDSFVKNVRSDVRLQHCNRSIPEARTLLNFLRTDCRTCCQFVASYFPVSVGRYFLVYNILVFTML